MLPILIGLISAAGWYLLVIFVFPFPRLEQIFCDRGIINYIITFIGFYGISLGIIEFIKNLKTPTEINQLIESIDSLTPSLDKLRESKNVFLSRVTKSYEYVSFFGGLAVSLGFLGTVLGIAGGIGSLSSVFADSGDLSAVKDGIFGLISNLGVAFDSTLLGLIFSILVSILASTCKQVNLKFISSNFDEYFKKALVEETAVNSRSDYQAKIEIGDFDDKKLENYLKIMASLGTKLQKQVEVYADMHEKLRGSHGFDNIQKEMVKSAEMLFKIHGLLKKRNSQKKIFKVIEESPVQEV